MSDTPDVEVQIISKGIPPHWPFLAGAGLGFIAALFLFAGASDSIMQDRINAGTFDRDGLVYTITLVGP